MANEGITTPTEQTLIDIAFNFDAVGDDAQAWIANGDLDELRDFIQYAKQNGVRELIDGASFKQAATTYVLQWLKDAEDLIEDFEEDGDEKRDEELGRETR